MWPMMSNTDVYIIQVYVMMRVFGLKLEIQKMYDVNPLFSFM